jgi:hypothetical protein
MNRSESQTLRRRDWIPLGGYEFRKIVGVGWIDELTNIDYRKGVPDRGRISTATCSMCSQARQADLFAVEVQGPGTEPVIVTSCASGGMLRV